MMEAWLLTDASALRRAAGNPNGRHPLSLPRPQEIEDLPDPKTLLRDLLLDASGLRGRRRRSSSVNLHRVAELTEGFEALRRLPAFQAMEAELDGVVSGGGWL
jgi:hypothetical protein